MWRYRSFRRKIPRALTIMLSAIFVLLTLASPVSVWAEPESPSNAEDIRSFNNDTSWFDATEGSNCALAGVTISGESPFLTGNPITLRYPEISNEELFAKAMEDFIRHAAPRSPWLDIENLGAKLAAEGKARDINPMLIIVIGRHETQLGTIQNSSARYNNSFGNKGENPPGSPDTDYKIYPSFEASLFGRGSFTEAVEARLEGQHPSYKDVTNMYEYLSVHVSGQIIYPDSNTASYDSTMGVVIDADGEDGYAGPLQYFENAINWIGDMTGMTISGIPTQDGADCTAGCIAKYNDVTVSFPVEPCTKRDYTTLPCNNSHSYTNQYGITKQILGCHHDGSPAFDLYWQPYEEMGGRKVFAVSDGRIVNAPNRYHGVDGCYSIQFFSTTENRYYWYGHLQKAPDYIQPGQENIKAGQPIAEVGSMELKNRGCSPGPPHLHIDRGCVSPGGVPQHGGSDDCRDPDYVVQLNTIWEGLAEDGSSL